MSFSNKFFLGVAALVFVLLPDTLHAQKSHLPSLNHENLRSVMRISRKMCIYPRITSEDVAKKFMECYDDIPGKEQFLTCQREAFNGRLFDSVENIRMNCADPLSLPMYTSCVRRELESAGIDANAAVSQLNPCHLALFGNYHDEEPSDAVTSSPPESSTSTT